MKYKCLIINVCCMVNLVDCLWEETWNRLNERLTSQFDACSEVLYLGRLRLRGLPRFKVKLICFVDTLMTLTSVNIKPTLLFSLLEQTQALARSIMLTIHGCATACSEALICWLQVLEERSWAHFSQMDVQFSLRDPSWGSTALLLACDLQVSCELICCQAVYWALLLSHRASSETSHSQRELTQRVVRAEPDVWPLPPLSLREQQQKST